MKRFFLLLSLVIFLQTITAPAQKTRPKPAQKKTPPAVKLDEKTEFENAVAIGNAAQRLAALEKFLADFPKTENKVRALELMVSARAEIGEEKLRFSETEAGLKMFKLAASEAPKPVSDELYTKVILQFPTNLFFRGQQAAAVEIAKIIEEKADGNAKQLLGLAAFYLGIENGDEAKRIAEKAVALDPNLPAAYQTLGLASRLNFDLENSVAAYTKALELDANSAVSKRSLAEMKRAVGKPVEAAALYREILEKDAGDGAAQTGLVLSLFDAEKSAEAEAELAKSLEANPNNLLLLVGAAYWYAGKNQAAKAVEYAQKAVAVEPRYTWAHITLARALMARGNPAEAEKTLLAARQYGNFPTLDYELASVRAAAGFYEEAARDLRKSFAVTKDGAVETRLGNRVARQTKDFIELLSAERRASIFQPLAADSAENAARMKNLLNFAQKLESKDATETEISEAAEEFVRGDDKTKTHRQIYAASRLLQKKTALPKALELTQSAVRGVDDALEIESPASFVLADELFESRAAAISRGQLVIVPAVSRQTLSTIVRGRIEEIAGWTLYNQEKPAEAAVRLKRAVGILPEKSAWWRSSMWRLGASLEAAGKLPEALDAYIKSYTSGEPDAVRRSVIETLYQRINGTLDGLDTRLEGKPKRETSFLIKQTENTETAKTQTPPATVTEEKSTGKSEVSPSPETAPENAPKLEETPQAKPEPSPTPGVEPSPEISPTPSPETSPQKIIEPATVSEPTPSPSPLPEETPTPSPEPSPSASPENNTETKTSANVEAAPETKAAQTPEPTPTPEIKPEPTPETKIETAPETKNQNLSNSRLQVVVTDNLSGETVAGNNPKPSPQTETSPTPVTSETNPEPSPAPSPENAPEQSETKSEPPPKLEVVVTENKPSPAETSAKMRNFPPNPPAKSKSAFEPVVINLPKSENDSPKNETTAEKNLKQTAEEKPKGETKPEENRQKNELIAAGEQRPRVFVTDNLANAPCSLLVNQERISLLNGGGMVGILAGYSDGDGDRDKIKAFSDRPADVVVELDPEVGKQTNQAFFIVKSVSTKTGVFTVTFDSPCGRKEVQVRVR